MNRNPHKPLAHAGARLVVLMAVALVLAGASVAVASAATYDPKLVISDDNLRASDSMSVADIQAFLNAQPGVLKSLVTTDYDHAIKLSTKFDNLNTTPDKGEKPARKRASQIIWEACQRWSINPKVMLTMLQKEQSLLTKTTFDNKAKTLARAIGAGCPGGLVYAKSVNPVATNKYPGFGNQMWYGAMRLDGYGEGKNGSTIPLFKKGIRVWIYKPAVTGAWVQTKKTLKVADKYDYEYQRTESGTTYIKTRIYSISKQTYATNYYFSPTNLGTYKLFIYNPSIGAKPPYGDLSGQSCEGNANFWKIYRKYFGDPFANPRMRPIYRLYKARTGDYLYTASVAERYRLSAGAKATWKYNGTVSSCDSSATTGTVPLYRFYNKKTHRHSYVTSHAVFLARTSASGKKTWTYQGVAFKVSTARPARSATVWKFANRATGVIRLTSSSSEAARYRTKSSLKKSWRYLGIAWYLPRI